MLNIIKRVDGYHAYFGHWSETTRPTHLRTDSRSELYNLILTDVDYQFDPDKCMVCGQNFGIDSYLYHRSGLCWQPVD
jgi:hypothetical protein